jgi:hypothetical protein
VLGPEAYDGFQAGARRLYMHPVLEPAGVLLPLIVHVVAGLRRIGFVGVSFALWWMPAWFYPYYTLFGAAALYHGGNGAWLALHALGLRRDASLPGGRPALFGPVAAGTVLLVLALLAFGGRLFPIADPRDNDYARMWERYGLELRTP